jgi:fatty-acyl-CoA synthase
MTTSIYDVGLEKNAANYASLSPLSFIAWSADVYPERSSVIHGARRYTWSETYTRTRRLASAIARRGIKRGETVSAMLANTPEMYEAHFGVPMSGAVFNALNTRLDADAIAFILRHAEAKLVLVDREFSAIVQAAVAQLQHPPLIVDVLDSEYQGGGAPIGSLDYEALLAEGDPAYAWQLPPDEWDAISLNYTSGTTGNPKGVVLGGAQQRSRRRAAAPRGLPVDAANVPLQRLVFPMDTRGQGRRQRVPAQGRGGRHLQCDPRASSHALLRRTGGT